MLPFSDSPSSSALPPGGVPSDEGQNAVDEQRHDGGAEQAGHGHRDEPSQEDVSEEAPVNGLLGADPAHGHDRAHLEVPARTRRGLGGRRGRKEQSAVARICEKNKPLKLSGLSEEAKSCGWCRFSCGAFELRLQGW